MKKVIAAALALIMTLLCASCSTVVVEIPLEQLLGGTGANTNTDTPANNDTPATQAPSADTSTEAPATDAPATQAPSGDTPATQAPVTQAPAGNDTPAATEAPTAAPGGAPSSKEDVIAYYVAAYNKIASDSKSVTRNYDYTSNYNNILNINNNSTLQKLATQLMNQFMVETKEDVASTPSDLPPVGVTNLSISPAQISEATCKDNGDTYTVVLKSTGTDDNYEVDSVVGQGSAGVIGPLLRTEDVSGAAGSLIKFEGLHAWYATASVTATVEKSTGHITHLDYQTPCILHFDQVNAMVIKVQNCDIGLLFQQKYTITY